ncbi:MAG: hypothetical protein ACI9JM_003319, partial [Halioglobus sp.]
MNLLKISNTARLALLIIGLSAALSASAILIFFEATIDGDQANAGAGTGGTATIVFEDSTNQFSWD